MPNTYGEDEGSSQIGKSAATTKRLSKAAERKKAFLEQKAAAGGGARVAPPIVLAPVLNSDFWNDVGEEQKPPPPSFPSASAFAAKPSTTTAAALTSNSAFNAPPPSSSTTTSTFAGHNSPALRGFSPPSSAFSGPVSGLGRSSPQIRGFGNSAPTNVAIGGNNSAAGFQLPPQSFNRFGTHPSSSFPHAVTPASSHSFGLPESSFGEATAAGGWGEDLGDIGLDASFENGTPQRASFSAMRTASPQQSLAASVIASPPVRMTGWGDSTIAFSPDNNNINNTSSTTQPFVSSVIDEDGLGYNQENGNNTSSLMESEFGFDNEGRPISNPGMLFIPRRASINQPAQSMGNGGGGEEVGITLPSPLPSPTEAPPPRRMSLANLGGLLQATGVVAGNETESGLNIPLESGASDDLIQPFYHPTPVSVNHSASTFHLSPFASFASPTERRPSFALLDAAPSLINNNTPIETDVSGVFSAPHLATANTAAAAAAAVNERGTLIQEAPFSGVAVVDEEGGLENESQLLSVGSNIQSTFGSEEGNLSTHNAHEDASDSLNGSFPNQPKTRMGQEAEGGKQLESYFDENKGDTAAAAAAVQPDEKSTGSEADINAHVEPPKESKTVNESFALPSSDATALVEDEKAALHLSSSSDATTAADVLESIPTTDEQQQQQQQQQQANNNNNNDEVASTNTNSTGVIVSPSRSRGWDDDLSNTDFPPMSASDQLESEEGVLVQSAAELSAAQRELLGGWGDEDDMLDSASLDAQPVTSGWGDALLPETAESAPESASSQDLSAEHKAEPQSEVNKPTNAEGELITATSMTTTSSTDATAPATDAIAAPPTDVAPAVDDPTNVSNNSDAATTSSVVTTSTPVDESTERGLTSELADNAPATTEATTAVATEESEPLLANDNVVSDVNKHADSSSAGANDNLQRTESAETVEKKQGNEESSENDSISNNTISDESGEQEQAHAQQAQTHEQDDPTAPVLSEAQRALLAWDDENSEVSTNDVAVPGSGWGGDDYFAMPEAPDDESASEANLPVASETIEQKHDVAEERQPSFIPFETSPESEEKQPLEESKLSSSLQGKEEANEPSSSSSNIDNADAVAAADGNEQQQPAVSATNAATSTNASTSTDATDAVPPSYARKRSYFDDDDQGEGSREVAAETPVVAVSSRLSYFDEPSPTPANSEALRAADTTSGAAAAPELTPEQQALLSWGEDLDIEDVAETEESEQSDLKQPQPNLVTLRSPLSSEVVSSRSLSQDYFGSSNPTTTSTATSTATTSTVETATPTATEISPTSADNTNTAVAVEQPDTNIIEQKTEVKDNGGWGDELDLPSVDEQTPAADVVVTPAVTSTISPREETFAHVVPRTPEKSSTLDKYFSAKSTSSPSSPVLSDVSALSSSPSAAVVASELETKTDALGRSASSEEQTSTTLLTSGWQDGLPSFDEPSDVAGVTAKDATVSTPCSTDKAIADTTTTTTNTDITATTNVDTTPITVNTSSSSPSVELVNEPASNAQSEVSQKSGWEEGLDLPFEEPSQEVATTTTTTNNIASATTNTRNDADTTTSSSGTSTLAVPSSTSGWDDDLGFGEDDTSSSVLTSASVATTTATPAIDDAAITASAVDSSSTNVTAASASVADAPAPFGTSGWDDDLGFDEADSLPINSDNSLATVDSATNATTITSTTNDVVTAAVVNTNPPSTVAVDDASATTNKQSSGWDDDLPSFDDQLDVSDASKSNKITPSKAPHSNTVTTTSPTITTPKSSPYDYFSAEPVKPRAVAVSTQTNISATTQAQQTTSSSVSSSPSSTGTSTSTTAPSTTSNSFSHDSSSSFPRAASPPRAQPVQSGWGDDLDFPVDESSQTTVSTTTTTSHAGPLGFLKDVAATAIATAITTLTGNSAEPSSAEKPRSKASLESYFAAEPKSSSSSSTTTTTTTSTTTATTSQSSLVSSAPAAETLPSSSASSVTATTNTTVAASPLVSASTAAPSTNVAPISAPTTTTTSTATPHIILPTVTTTATPFTPTFYSFTPTPSGMFTPSVSRASSITVSPSTPPTLLVEEINRLRFDLEQANTQVFKAKCAVKLLNRNKQDNATQIADLQRQLAGQGVSAASSESSETTAAAAAANATALKKISDLETELKNNQLLLTQKTDLTQELQHSLEGQVLLLTQKQALIDNLTRESANVKQQLAEARDKANNVSAIDKMTENFKKAKILAAKFKEQFALKETELAKLQEHVKSLAPSSALSQETLEQQTQLMLVKEEVERRKIREQETYVALEEMRERVKELQEQQKLQQQQQLTTSSTSTLTLPPSSPSLLETKVEDKCEQCEKNQNLAQELAQREEDLSAHHSELEELRKSLKLRETDLSEQEARLTSSRGGTSGFDSSESESRMKELSEQISSYESTIQTLKESAKNVQTEQSMQLEAQTTLIAQLKEMLRKQDEELNNSRNSNRDTSGSRKRSGSVSENIVSDNAHGNEACAECARLQGLLALEQSTLDDLRRTLDEEREEHAREILDLSSSLESTHKGQIQILQHQLASQSKQLLALQTKQQEDEKEQQEKEKEEAAVVVEERVCAECAQLKIQKQELEAKIESLSPPLPPLPCETCVSLQQQLDLERESLSKEQEAHRITINKLNEAKKESNSNRQMTVATTPEPSRREGRLEERILMLREGLKERDTFIKVQGNHFKNAENELKTIREDKEKEINELRTQIQAYEKKGGGGVFGFLKKKKPSDPNADPGPGFVWNGRAWVKEEGGGAKTKIPPLPPLPSEVVLPPSPTLSPENGVSSRNGLPQLSLGRISSDPPPLLSSTNRFMQKHAATPQSRYLNTFDHFGSSSDGSSSSVDPGLASLLAPLDSSLSSSLSSSTSTLITPRGRTKLPSRNKLLAVASERKLELVKEESTSKLDEEQSSSSQPQHSEEEVADMKKRLASYEENEQNLLPGGAVGEDKSLLDTIRQLRQKNADVNKELQAVTTKLRQLEQSEVLAKANQQSSASGSVSQQEFLAMKLSAQKQAAQLNTEISTLNSKLKNAQTHRDELLEELKKYSSNSVDKQEGSRASTSDVQEQVDALQQKSVEEELRASFQASKIAQQTLENEVVQLKNALEAAQKQIDSLQQGGDLSIGGGVEEEDDEKDNKNGGPKLVQRKLVRLTKQLAQATARIKQLESEPPKVSSSLPSAAALSMPNLPVRRFPPPSSNALLGLSTEDEKKSSVRPMQMISNGPTSTNEDSLVTREHASFLASVLRENEQLRRLVVKLTRRLARVNHSESAVPASIQSSRRLVRSLSSPNLEVALWSTNLVRSVERLTSSTATLSDSEAPFKAVRRSGCRIFSRLLFSWFFTALIAMLLTEAGNL